MFTASVRLILAASTCFASLAQAQPAPAVADSGLLFSLSGNQGATADRARGAAGPIFANGVNIVADGASGPALSLDHDLTLAWEAPGNIQAQRGTLAFHFRGREAIGTTPFAIFRVGSSDSSSWDMVWLRIDWNGHGFDAFVTDTNLARTRVSFDLPAAPAPTAWTHIAFAWDEAVGVQLWVDGRPAARKTQKATYDAGLFGFGPFQRIVSPYQVHSANNFRRSGDIDEIRIYDHMLGDVDVAALARREEPAVPAAAARSLADAGTRAEWWLRYGWNRPGDTPAYLADPATRIRKVEFTDTRDGPARMFRGADGIRETTWPGVYNRSRLPGRHDYFELPDWNVYSTGGKHYDLTLPDEPWNRIEITGAAYGTLSGIAAGKSELIARRAQGQERTSTQLSCERRGGALRFENVAQETPIQEIAVYDVTAGAEPVGYARLDYVVRANADPAAYSTLTPLLDHIDGRFPADERATVVALPANAPPSRPHRATNTPGLPVLHILIPADFRDHPTGRTPQRLSYGWSAMNAGLDGIAIDLPALAVKATHNGTFPLNIRVRDPQWPDRDMLDINVAVKPGEPRTLWLDTRDRILPPDKSLYISIAGAGGDFDAAKLDGARVRLIFKAAAAAKAEHVADRFEQARDNLSFLVEEQPNSRLYPVFTRFERDITDVLKVDPDNAIARSYWVEKNPEQPYAPFAQPQPPASVPLWAFRQVEDLKLYRKFIDWWIDKRQIANGEFGGGLSDDTDLVNQWVPLALMGVQSEKLIASQRKLLDATYANGLWTNGLSRIRADELHSYEEGINSVAQAMQMRWGDPGAIERGMEVARNYARLAGVNPAGHTHFVSAYFSGADIVRESVWGWQRQYSFLVTHPGLLLVNYNGAPAVRSLILALADGWLAHGKQDAKGNWSYPAEIEWATDASRGSGMMSAMHVFWATYTWTGDVKYLRPLQSEIARGNLGAITNLNADVLARMPGGPALAATISAGALASSGAVVDRNLGVSNERDAGRFVRWQQTGDKTILADLYGAEILADSQRMHLLTEGHLWSDRVSVPSELLQRARMGGVAHRRNGYFPGNLVSWHFAEPDTAEKVAILIPIGDPRRFKVIAYNLSDRPVTATMLGAELTPGQWRISGGDDADGDDKADTPGAPRDIVLERGLGTDLVLAPGRTTVFDASLVTLGDDPATRADIGISRDDVTAKGNRLTVRIHSLGAKPTPGGTVLIEDAAGNRIASARFRPLAAPLDLIPKTHDARLTLPRTAARSPLRVRLELDGAPAEVTATNNLVTLN